MAVTVPSKVSLLTDIQPGKIRNPDLDIQFQKAGAAINALLATRGNQPARIVLNNNGIQPEDYWILADATAGALTLSLPLSASGSHGVGVKKIDASSNTVTVAAAGMEKIDGAATKVITLQYEAYQFVSDGQGAWWIF